MKSDLFIRADGSGNIGLGHLVRCTSLSTFLKDQFNITFVCREIPSATEIELNQAGYSVVRIDSEHELFALLSPSSIVVLDSYAFDAAYHKQVKEHAAKLVCIDDLHDKEFYADLIINHAPGIKQSDYTAQAFTQYALGLDYVLLRPPFLEAAVKKRKTNKEAETVLVCFGGSDFKDLTSRAVDVVLEFEQFKKIVVITGPAYGKKEELLKKIQNEKKIVHYHALSGKKMAGAFMESDVAIVPSSGILFEALATGNITISGTYIDNQKEMYSGFKELGAIVDAGEFSAPQLRNAIEHIRSQKSTQTFIDGKSPERIQRLFKSLTRG